MKLSAALSALAFTGAVAPPRIELNLEGMSKAYKLENPIMRAHDQALKQNSGDKVTSRQDWTEKCPAYRKCALGKECDNDESGNWILTSANDHKDCPFPEAKGYDHQDQGVMVTTRIFLVDEDGAAKTGEVKKVDFTQRSTYLFKFDASDNAGNHAEQVVFALILDDSEAPYFRRSCEGSTLPVAPAVTVEAASDWELCELNAFDNVDHEGVHETRYSVVYLGRNHNEFLDAKVGFFNHAPEGPDTSAYQNVLYSKAKEFFTPVDHVGKYLVTFTTQDHAGVYGHNAEDNTRKTMQAILIRDTVQPTIYLAGSDPVYVECVTNDATLPESKQRKVINSNSGNWDFEAYTGLEADCRDQLDTVLLSSYLPVTTNIKHTDISNVVGGENTKGVYPQFTDSPQLKNKAMAEYLRSYDRITQGIYSTIEYTCDDFSSNDATKVTREIKTTDTHKPTLTLLTDTEEHIAVGSLDEHGWSATHVVLYSAHKADGTTTLLDATDKAWAKDSCEAGVTSDSITKSWGPRQFNSLQLGDYVRTYTVSDSQSNSATKTRTYTVVDEESPEISVLASSTNCGEPGTFEATRDKEYTDSGATCHDMVDGVINHAVEVSGEVVNLRIPGTYVIEYDCEDLSGNSAPRMSREIIVKDSSKPVLTLQGHSVVHVEAGFPYVDAGATATDSLDGDVTQYIWTDGNTVNTKAHFFAYQSCEGIHKNHPNFENGLYYITIKNPDGQYRRELVHCFESGNKGYTYYVHSAAEPQKCTEMGMVDLGKKIPKIETFPQGIKREGSDRETWVTIMNYIKTEEEKSYEMIGNKNYYVCTVRWGNVLPHMHPASGEYVAISHKSHHEITNREHGKFEIKYNVEDKAGNAAMKIKRTVIVQDTLPPVITLSLNKKLVVASAHNQLGHEVDTVNGVPVHSGSMVNPAGYAQAPANSPGFYSGFGNPNMRIEDNRDEIEKTRAPSPAPNTVKTHAQIIKGAKTAKTGASEKYSDEKEFHDHSGEKFSGTGTGELHDYNANFGPNFMAESSSTNGWLIGAVASAVAGVALLGFSARKSTVTVPV